MKRWLPLLLAAALWGPASAQTGGGAAGGGGGSSSVIPSGGTTAATLTNVAGRVLTPYDFGAKGDARRMKCTLSTSGNTLTINSAACTSTVGSGAVTFPGFTAADVGKYIVVHGAGATLGTAPVASAAVGGTNNAYTTIPTIAVTDATSGGGALITANEGLDTATVNAGGSGCTNSLATFTVVGGTNTVVATFTATPSGGALVGPLTVAAAGNYSGLPATTGAAVTGGNCTGATINSTWHQNTPTVVFPGYNYTAPTATYSAGNATLTLTLATAGVVPYASTITGFTSSTVVTVGGGGFGQTLASSAQYFSYGSDDSAAINAGIAAAGAAGASNVAPCFYIPPAPNGYWGAASAIALNPNGTSSCIRGAGIGQSQILALASMTALASRGTDFIRSGGTFEDFTFDGNKVTTNVAYFQCSQRLYFTRVGFFNAASQNGATATMDVLDGDGVSSCNESKYLNIQARNDPQFYVGDATANDMPTYCVEENTSDANWQFPIGTNCAAIQFYQSTHAGDLSIVGAHFWNSTGYFANEGYDFNASSEIVNIVCDGINQFCAKLNASNASLTGGAVLSAVGNAALTQGIVVGSSLNNIEVEGFQAQVALSTAANRVVLPATVGTDVRVFANPGVLDNILATIPVSDVTSIGLGSGAIAGITSTPGNYNLTGIGFDAVQAAVTANSDTGIGANACQNTTGNNNVCVGSFAGQFVGIGNSETFVGVSAGVGVTGAKTSGSQNTGIGNGALQKCQGACVNNEAIGYKAGQNITTGGANIAIGSGVASTTLQTGLRNILIGTASNCDTAGAATNDTFQICDSTTGAYWLSGSLVAGAETLATPATVTINNATFKVVTLAAATAIDTVCYTTATGLFTEEPTGTTCTVSDERKKVGMQPIDTQHSLDIVLGSKPISFYYVPELDDPNYHLGFGAQTLAKIAPELVTRDEAGVPNAVKQIELLPVTWAAIQQLQKQITELKARLDKWQ